MKKLQDCWNEIRSTGLNNDSGIMILDSEIPLIAYAVVEGTSEGVAIVIKQKINSKIETFESHGMRFEKCELFGHNGVKILHNSRNRDEFLVFMADLLSATHYKDSNDPLVCLTKFVEIVIRWKNLFKVIGDKNYFDIKGFFGELHVMKQLILAGVNQSEMLESWQIDRRSRVDYIFNSKKFELEVKTIESQVDKKVPISSIEQLTNFGRIQYLVVNKVKTGAGLTINDIYLALREILDEQLRPKLDHLFIEFKIPPLTLKNFDSSKFTVGETLFFKVDDSFPRLTRQSIHEGIASASYEISLSSIPLTNHSSLDQVVGILK